MGKAFQITAWYGSIGGEEMKIRVKGVTHNIGYALWKLYKLEGESDQEFLDRATSIDNALRECDDKRMAKVAERNLLANK